MGKKALAGQPGIHDVVMAVRNKPFREWNVVYYDPKKTDLEKIEKRLRQKGCPKARRDVAKPKKSRGVTLVVENPVVTPGDCVLVSVKLPKGRTGKASLVPPQKWKVRAGKERAVKGGKTPALLALQTTRKTPPGKHEFRVKVHVVGKVLTFKVEVELVKKVG